MTTIAYGQYSNIPNMGGSYNGAPVNGPLSTNQTPHAMGTHNLGVLRGKHPNPPKFYPADNSGDYSGARQQYVRTNTTEGNFTRGILMYSGTKIGPTGYSVAGQHNHKVLVSKSTKYVAPASSGMFTSARKAAALGKSSFKQGLPDSSPLSFKNYNTNDARDALRSARSSGAVAPKKKGSIIGENPAFTPSRNSNIYF
jgi:hypothetical protein